MIKVDFNNRLHTQSPRVTVRRFVLTTVLKHALLPAAITRHPLEEYLPAKWAVKERSEGRAKMSNEYEIRVGGAFALFSSEQAFCINFPGKKETRVLDTTCTLSGAREGECVGRGRGYLHTRTRGVTAAPTLMPALALLRRGAHRKEEAARGRGSAARENGRAGEGKEGRERGSGWKWVL